MKPSYIEIAGKLFNLANCSRVQKEDKSLKFIFDHLVERTYFYNTTEADNGLALLDVILADLNWYAIGDHRINLDRVSCFAKTKSEVEFGITFYFDGIAEEIEIGTESERNDIYDELVEFVEDLEDTEWFEPIVGDRMINVAFITIVKKLPDPKAIRYVYSDQMEQIINYDSATDADADFAAVALISGEIDIPYGNYSGDGLGSTNI